MIKDYNNIFLESDKILLEPVQPGVYLVMKFKAGIVTNLALKQVSYSDDTLKVRAYLNTDDLLSVSLPAQKLEEYNRKDLRWYLLQVDLSKDLL